jgi:4-hydroxy-tetrahydrodipicolinate synthase
LTIGLASDKERGVRTETDFSGLWIPLVTPFHKGRVDHPALAALVQRLGGCGVAGFVACGSTGEAAALDTHEQLALLDTVMAASTGLPVVMGLSGYQLKDTCHWLTTLCEHPIAGVLVPPPAYIRPSQAGLLRWFQTLADAATVPLIVYDIPYRTGVTITRDTLLTLGHHPRIRAVKDCGGDAGKTLAVLAQGRLQVLAGEDLQIFASVAQGAVGAIAASAHVGTSDFVHLLHLLRDGDLPAARALWNRLVPWIELAFAEPNPALIKAALARAGHIRNELRLPMQRASSARVAQIGTCCANLA